MKTGFQCFVGVDQTGAVRPDGVPHPLPCAILVGRDGEWALQTVQRSGKSLSIPSFTHQALEELLATVHVHLDHRVAVLVDCVFGLPWQSWREAGERPGDVRALIRTCAFEQAYGRNASAAFFGRWNATTTFHRRECERVAGSNSLFQLQPAQKNIQTGTYRIWRDLAASGDEDLFSFWPFDALGSGRAWVFEGYPSFYWKNLFGCRSRSAAGLKKVFATVRGEGIPLRIKGKAAMSRNPDLADAGVLALAGLMLQRRERLFQPFESFPLFAPARAEGWIAGVAQNSST